MISLASARKQVAGHGECKDHHFLHEQRREKQLQQLHKHFPPHHRRPSICSNYSEQTAEASYVYILRNTEWLPLRNVNDRHDFLPTTTSGETHLFNGITKAFDLVSRQGLFKILLKIDCPPKQQIFVESFHMNMRRQISFSEPFKRNSGVEYGYVLLQCYLCPVCMLLKPAFGTFME